MLYPVNSEESVTTILNLQKGKSPGYDDITNDTLHIIYEQIVNPLTHILNLSFSTGIFPRKLKIAKVIQIHKGGK